MPYCTDCGVELQGGERYCPDCGSEVEVVGESEPATDNSEEQWQPRYPILSVFAALMLLWAGFWSLGAPGPGAFDFILFTGLGLLIIPRVRYAVLELLKEKSQGKWDVTSRAATIAIGGIYGLMVIIATLLLIGEGAQDSASPASSGIVTTVLVFIFAAVIVASIRVFRRIA